MNEQQRQFFDENGYVRLEGVVSKADCDAVIDAAFGFLEMDKSDPSDWYRLPLTPGGMIEMYQHPALWNNRQNPAVYDAFRSILGRDDLWVTFDRANLKPPANPAHPEYDHAGFLHWDIDPTNLAQTRFGVQGVLYLADTDESMGGFCCVPGHHRLLQRWASGEKDIPGAPSEKNSRVPGARDGLEVTPIVGNAGDLVIWDTRLLHGNGRNISDRPRLAQYISMFPAEFENETVRDDRVSRWRERLAPDAFWAPGDPRKRERTHQETARLTELGEKLLGKRAW